MNAKKKLLFLFLGLLLTFLLPNFSWGKEYDDSPHRTSSDGCHFNVTTVNGSSSKFGLMSVDTGGTLLCFDNPAKVSGTGTDSSIKQGDVYKYTNVITIDGQQVNAKVTVQEVVNINKAVLDDPAPNPSGNRTSGGAYTTAFGAVVPEGAVFAPQLWSLDKTKEAYVKFFIEFLDTTGKPIVLKNVYNNSLDVESTEYNAYGGFVSYRLASDNKTNTASRILATSLGSQIRFSSSDCAGDAGLYIKDQSRVQAKFATLTSLVITTGQFANGQVPAIGGGVSNCTNKSQRYYGAIFVQDSFDGTNVIEYTAPKVDSLITDKTKPTLTGKIGGEISTSSPDGSALGTLGTGDSFTVNVAGVTYTAGDGKLSTNGVDWTLNIPVDLIRGTTYEVIATRNGVLIDQTNNELVISPICTKPQYLNAAGTACITPSVNDIFLCHSGNGVNYTKIAIPASGLNGHETHEFDVAVDGSGRCPDAPKDKACTAVGQPFPAGAQTDGKKVTICHFPPGNINNVQMISISVNALDVHIGHHYDTIWEVGKSCPRTIDDCDHPNDTTLTNPTVDFLTTTDTLPTLTGTIGNLPATSGTAFSVSVNGTKYDYQTAGNSSTLKTAITITDTNWSLKTTTAIPPGNYEVVATRTETTGTGGNKVVTTLVDEQHNELTILPSCKETQAVIDGKCVDLPTVVIKQIDGKSYDGVNAVKTSNTKPVIKGIVGDKPLGADEDFIVIINNVQYSKKAGKVSVPDSMNWTLTMPVDLPIGIYDIVGDRDNGLGDTTREEMEITPPMPTVEHPNKTDDTTPTIKGTVGTTDLVSTDKFSVTVKAGSVDAVSGFTQQVYTYKTDAALTVNGKNWELTIPDNKVLEAGTYEIEAVRNTVKDESSDELVVNQQCKVTETLFNGVCKSNSEFPTVDNQTTPDTMPTLTGTVGTSVLGAAEEFTVEIAGTGQIYSKSSGTVHISGTTLWSVDVTTPLTVNTYDIIATRDNSLKDKTSNELTIITCAEPKKIKDGKCVTESKVPTVNKLVTDVNATKIEVTGTVGDVVLGSNETFTVKIHNSQHADIACSLPRPTTTTWTCTLTAKPFVAGIFDVDAVRAGVPDVTSGELEITDNIAICENNVTKSIPKTSWEPSKWGASYYLGNCDTGGSEEFPTKPCSIPPVEGEECTDLPLEPIAKPYEVVPPTGSFCDDGGAKNSDAELSGLTIKRARIANTTTTKAIPDLIQLVDVNSSNSKHPLKYGEMANGAGGTMDIRDATITGGNQAYPVTLTGVTLNNAFIDTQNDYIQNGVDTNAGTYLKIEGGSTKGTLMQGVITAGNDATGHPVRGSVTVGKYDGGLPDNALTKGRRIQGTLTNATIINARTTTKHGETRIDAGEIQSGTIEDAKIFGTVVNATLTNATITETNHCFSSGTIGNKGQLNWKEVVK